MERVRARGCFHARQYSRSHRISLLSVGTLLNEVFGTSFEMMDVTKGANQTTKGIWMDVAPKSAGTIVVDLEGTDSQERKAAGVNFEKQGM